MEVRDPACEPPLLGESVAARLNGHLASGALVGGWLISGPPGVGKATLAFALARTVLSGGSAIGDEDARAVDLIAAGSHPDLTVLRRSEDDKGRLRKEIVVKDVRELIDRAHLTSSAGRRVAIVDTADDLNRNAANALLKILEEPPAGALFLLLSNSPGRLLPTVRSRCRRIALTGVSDETIVEWLCTRHDIGQADALAAVARAGGRPGRALALATGEGREARALADGLLDAIGRGERLVPAAQKFSERSNDSCWAEAQQIVVDEVGRAIRCKGAGEQVEAPLGNVQVGRLLELHEDLQSLARRGLSLNADKSHIALVMGLRLQDATRGRHAR
jgi:DNA polymerase-3 subunit delta'